MSISPEKGIDRMIFETICNKIDTSRVISDRLLTEEDNLYNGIFDDVDKITRLIIEMIQTGKFNNEYEFKFVSESLHTNTIKIKLYTDKVAFNGQSKIAGTCFYLDINMGLILKYYDEDTIYDVISRWLESTIIHELTHGKNFSEIQKKGCNTDIPEWYLIASDYILREGDKDSFCFGFFYGLYLSYYSEIQAISTEISGDVMNKIKYDKEWKDLSVKNKIARIVDYIKSNKHYIAYVFTKDYTIPMLQNSSLEDKQKIVDVFSEYDFTININNVNRYLKQIDFGCDRGLAKIKRSENWLLKRFGLIK